MHKSLKMMTILMLTLMMYGNLKLFDLKSGQPVGLELPQTVGLFRWQQ